MDCKKTLPFVFTAQTTWLFSTKVDFNEKKIAADCFSLWQKKLQKLGAQVKADDQMQVLIDRWAPSSQIRLRSFTKINDIFAQHSKPTISFARTTGRGLVARNSRELSTENRAGARKTSSVLFCVQLPRVSDSGICGSLFQEERRNALGRWRTSRVANRLRRNGSNVEINSSMFRPSHCSKLADCFRMPSNKSRLQFLRNWAVGFDTYWQGKQSTESSF